MPWYWIGFEDKSEPRGQRAKGCVILQATNEEAAHRAASLRFPAWTAHVGEVPADRGPPPRTTDASRWLDNAQAADLAVCWGLGGIASADDIKASMEDDDAKPGSPLFRRNA